MAFLAALKKGSKDNPFAKFKEKEEEKEAIYIPLAECTKAVQSNNSDNNNIDNNDDTKVDDHDVDIALDDEHKDGIDEASKNNELKPTSIACISDIHMKLKELKMVPADILVLSGDFTNDGTIKEAEIVNQWLGEMRQQFGYKHIVAISGNHEGYGDILICDELQSIEDGETLCIGDEQKEKEYEQQESVRVKTQRYLGEKVMTNVDHYLYDEALVIEGIKFYGSPYVITEC